MTKDELYEDLEIQIYAPREERRIKEIKRAFAALKEHLETNWWIRLARKIRGHDER